MRALVPWKRRKKVKCWLNRKEEKVHNVMARLRPYNYRLFWLKAIFYFAFIQKVTATITIYLLSSHSDCSLTRPSPSVVCKECNTVRCTGSNFWKVEREILSWKQSNNVLFSVEFVFNRDPPRSLHPAIAFLHFRRHTTYWDTCPPVAVRQ